MQTPLYDDIDLLLRHYGLEMGASECHGMLCGMVSWPVTLDASQWARSLLAGELDEPGAAVSFELSPEDEAALSNVFNLTLTQLDDPELTFGLFLPDDETSLVQRTMALKAWCDGYLYGLNLTGNLELHKLSAEAQEFSRDLLDISRLEHDPDEGEEGETAFFEIVEYVRMGVLMLRDELLALDADNPDPHSPTLH